MTISPRGATVDITNLQPVDILHLYFSLYNVTSILGFYAIINGVCANKITLWVFPTASKIEPVRIIRFILTTSNNEQRKCKCMRVDEDGALVKSTYFTDLCVYEFNITPETTGVNSSWLNSSNERHNQFFHNMVSAALIESNQH